MAIYKDQKSFSDYSQMRYIAHVLKLLFRAEAGIDLNLF